MCGTSKESRPTNILSSSLISGWASAPTMNLTACMAQLADSCSKGLKGKTCKAGINNDEVIIIIHFPDLCRKLCGVGHCDVH